MGSFWSQPIRVECKDKIQLITARTVNSLLWFVNNPELLNRILGYLAKYQAKYEVVLYAFVVVGNHYHLLAKFPKGRRSEFFRDFNARIAEAVNYNVQEFLGGPLFERRYTPQVLPLDIDVENYFFYCALQPVSSGLTERISEYESYNSFHDAASQRDRTFKLFRFGEYNAAKRMNPGVTKEQFTDEHVLHFEKLPHLSDLTPTEYKKTLLEKMEIKRIEIVKDRAARKKPFFGKQNLKKVVPGSLPNSTKRGGMRPLVLSCSREAKNQFLSYYFAIVEAYRKAVEEYKCGVFDTVFPEGTFRPHGMCLCSP